MSINCNFHKSSVTAHYIQNLKPKDSWSDIQKSRSLSNKGKRIFERDLENIPQLYMYKKKLKQYNRKI